MLDNRPSLQWERAWPAGAPRPRWRWIRFAERGKAHRQAAELTARIAAETLARYLGQAGFVVMKRPPAKTLSTPAGG